MTNKQEKVDMSKYNKSYRVSSVITHTSTFNLSILITKYVGIRLTYSKNTRVVLL